MEQVHIRDWQMFLFKITSKTTGESHIVVTDKNGQFSTASDWASHKKKIQNAGKSSEDGIWFGTSEPDDSKRGHYFMTLMRLRSYLVNPTKV